MKATVTKIQSAQPKGEYRRTAIDDAKDAADILIIGFLKSKTIIRSKLTLAGKGIDPAFGEGTFLCTEKALAGLRSRYSVMTDF